jgi:hypothetical protein
MPLTVQAECNSLKTSETKLNMQGWGLLISLIQSRVQTESKTNLLRPFEHPGHQYHYNAEDSYTTHSVSSVIRSWKPCRTCWQLVPCHARSGTKLYAPCALPTTGATELADWMVARRQTCDAETNAQGLVLHHTSDALDDLETAEWLRLRGHPTFCRRSRLAYQRWICALG